MLAPPRSASITAVATPSNAQPIQHLTVNLAISRDPTYVAPAFQNAPRVVSTQTGISAAPFADGDTSNTGSLIQFAQDFEAAFPGLKMTTGPDHVQGAAVVAKPSMLGAVGSSSANGRGLWVVNFTADGAGFTYKVDGASARFFGVPPLSTDMWNGVDIAVPTYDSVNGLKWPGKTMNFRGVDPDQWNRSFLAAVDLSLSPAYAVNGATNTTIAGDLALILTAKGDIANGLSGLVEPIIDAGAVDADALTDAQTAMKQQLLVALGRLYEVQVLVQMPVVVQGGGSDPTTAPQLSGKLVAQVVTTPADGGAAVDPAHPLATLAAQCGVSDVYLATVIARTPRIIRPGVTVTVSGTPYETQAEDTLASIAADVFHVDVPTLAAGMTTGASKPNPFQPSTAINVTPLTAPATLTQLTTVASWFTITLEDVLTANSERTDFFTGASVTAGKYAVPVSGQSVAAMATTFGGLTAMAEMLGEVDAGGLGGGYALNPAAPPRGLQLLPQMSFTTAKAPLSSGSHITSLFSVKDPAAHKSVTLNLDYRVNQLEFDIHGVAGITGYQNSSWLSFVIPLADTPQTAMSAGAIQIPVPLTGYPSPVVISDQTASTGWPGAAQATETQWNYGFSALRQTAVQDILTVEVRFNSSGGANAVNGSVNPTPSKQEAVIEALAAFSVVWPAIADDLAQLPDLAAGATPSPAIVNAMAALQTLTTNVQTAWKQSLVMLASGPPETVYEYALSALTQGDPPYFSALILDRLNQESTSTPDAFVFTLAATQADIDALNKLTIPADLTAAFSDYGFAGGEPQVVATTPNQDWSVVDEAAVQITQSKPTQSQPQVAFDAPQTYRILYDDTTNVFNVYRQYLWPALRLTPAANAPPSASDWLGATQAGSRLVFELPANAAMVDQPLGLDFDFYRLNLLLMQNAWGGSYVSRNANLIEGAEVNSDFVYQTALAMFPTKVTPYFDRAEAVPLTGAGLEEALSDFFKTLVSAQTATAPGSTRDIRVLARYRQAIDGTSDPALAVLTFDVPLVLVPLHDFNVSTDWATATAISFVAQLAQAMGDNATAAGIPQASPGQYVMDVLVYNMDDGNAAPAPQPLLRLENLTFPRS